ncbi:hypothetical protein FQN60_015341, partial [Etheostoma spectabile]
CHFEPVVTSNQGSARTAAPVVSVREVWGSNRSLGVQQKSGGPTGVWRPASDPHVVLPMSGAGPAGGGRFDG